MVDRDVMKSEDNSAISQQGAGQRGLWRLMLKLPGVRGQLQMLVARQSSLITLCEAYEDASVTLEKMRMMPGDAHCAVVREYEGICLEIEADIIQRCFSYPPSIRG